MSAVSQAPRPPTELALDDGATVSVAGATAELRDARGRLLVRYVDGRLTIEADEDLSLSAPGGRVVIEARDGIDIRTEGELRQRAGNLDVEARTARIAGGVVRFLARDVTAVAMHLAQRVERAELEATHLLSRTQFAVREVGQLARERFGRLTTKVDGDYDLSARRADLSSEEDTSIDGKRVLLG